MFCYFAVSWTAKQSFSEGGKRPIPRRFFTRSGLSFEHGPSLAFEKNTAVLQSSCLLPWQSEDCRMFSKKAAVKQEQVVKN